MGCVDISGEAPRYASVNVLDEHGKIIATAQAGRDRKWQVCGVPLATGTHRLTLDVQHEGVSLTDSTIVAVEPDDFDDEPDADEQDTGVQVRAQQRYRSIVQGLAAGGEYDFEYVEAVLLLAEKSPEEMWLDVAIEEQQLAAEATARDDYNRVVEFLAAGGSRADVPGGVGAIARRADKTVTELITDIELARELNDSNSRLGIR